MSAEQSMLNDLLCEVPDLMAEADGESREYRAGVFQALGLLQRKLNTFDIDQSRFTRPMPDVETWYIRGEQ